MWLVFICEYFISMWLFCTLWLLYIWLLPDCVTSIYPWIFYIHVTILYLATIIYMIFCTLWLLYIWLLPDCVTSIYLWIVYIHVTILYLVTIIYIWLLPDCVTSIYLWIFYIHVTILYLVAIIYIWLLSDCVTLVSSGGTSLPYRLQESLLLKWDKSTTQHCSWLASAECLKTSEQLS